MNDVITLAGRKIIKIHPKIILSYYKAKQREKTISKREREFTWLTLYVLACHGVSF